MIYLFYGSDTEKVRAKAFQWVAAARAKAPEAPYVRLSSDAITQETLAEAAGSQGLFFSKTLVLLDDPFSLAEAGDTVLENLSMLTESPNPVAILAPKLLAVRAKKLEAKAEKLFKYDRVESAPARGFNAPLVNTLAARDGRALWKEITLALRAGDAPEMLHGLLHWKARDMMQKGSSVWGKDGARTLSLDLIELLSESRGGSLPFAESLERFALTV
ncbi:hypothetical protein L0Y34_01185 [Candidatus Parcubacteria bacterium]|nr:hypothetical protein [Candidatus Parcubacteria bacterium]